MGDIVYYGTLQVRKAKYTSIIHIPNSWDISVGDMVYFEYAKLGTEDWIKDMRTAFINGNCASVTVDKNKVDKGDTLIVKMKRVILDGEEDGASD